MKVLVGFEYSGIVREAFTLRGHDAMSCDLKPTEKLGKHYQGDFFDIAYDGWDLIIAHPPCTFLAVSGNRWYAGTQQRDDAVKYVEKIWDIPVGKLCIENPVGVLSTQSKLPKPQYIQPWQFGHGETKKTGLWLRGLPPLQPTHIVSGREQRIFKMAPSESRSAERSRTYSGIAEAMADQWG
jgi:hypothetical protein